MSHLDPDVAALLALSEREPTVDERAHLDSCASCAAELASLERVLTATRSGSGGVLLSPPPRVWEAIAAELQLSDAAPSFSAAPAEAAGRAAPTAREERTTSDPEPSADAAAEPTGGDGAAGTSVRTGEHRAPRRRSRRWVAALAGLAAAAAVVVAVWGFAVPRAQIVAEAALESFPGWAGASGEAVLESRDGHSLVVVNLAADVPADGYREVWLLASDGSALISLGVLDGPEGEFAVPDEVDLDRFRVVDVSQEEVGGDPGHSGDSIVRGELTSA
jgi:hypothetical protein